MIDTHTHLYLEQFDADRTAMMERAKEAGVTHMCLPDIELATTQRMLDMCHTYGNVCLPLIGVHPCSIKADFQIQLSHVEHYLFSSSVKFYGIGEIGLDYYWDRTFVDEQSQALEIQLDWAGQLKLPVSLHTRDATEETIELVGLKQDGSLTGVFHCFGGDYIQARRIIDMGFFLGIGGVVTYKKSTLPDLLKKVGIEHVVLETDAPYLPPVPYRGQRNEPAYLVHIVNTLSDILDLTTDEVKRITNANAFKIFNP